MKTVQLRDNTIWDKCRSCGRTWEQVTHSSQGQCRGCRSQNRPIDEDIEPILLGGFLSSDLKSLVLYKETKDKYGYDVDQLSFGSVKSIIHKCPECGTSKETPFKLFAKNKNIRHIKCKVEQTRRTNQLRYGVLNSCNQTQLIQNRLEKKDEEIAQNFEKEGYQVLSIERVDAEIMVHFMCPQGHKHKITYKAWKAGGQRCGKCFGNNGRVTIGVVKDSFEKEGYSLCTTLYEDNNTELFYICSKGHYDSTSWKIWERGHRCPICNPSSTSKGEAEITNVFKQFNPTKTREVISPYELDVYFQEQQLAVEYCGLYWHSDSQERIESSYHYKKMKACNAKGIRLITLFEDEWKDKKEICISRINHALGLTGVRLYARQCEIKEISKEESNAFLTQNHLQGFSKNTKTAFGLYHKGELVYVASVGLPSRQHTSQGKQVLELKRMAPKIGLNVVGGAGKMFKAICKYARENGYESIKSYCDMRWGTGGVYQKLGMVLQGQTHFTPHYTNGRIRQRNQTFANKEVPKGWYKIYDCGHQTWDYTL